MKAERRQILAMGGGGSRGLEFGHRIRQRIEFDAGVLSAAVLAGIGVAISLRIL